MKNVIESLLYISGRPLSFKELAKLTNQKISDIEAAVKELIDEYNLKDGGIKIIQNGNQVEMVTNPKNAEIVQKFLQEELTGELTPASLETLSIIAYRQPITREELEQIRGVNCAIILRNLMIRGLIDEEKENGKILYRVSLDFLRHLGISDVKELPDYERLHSINIQSPANNNL
jgi:segregation and condensation protein B